MTGAPVLLDVVPPSSFEPLAVQYRTLQAEASNTLVRQVWVEWFLLEIALPVIDNGEGYCPTTTIIYRCYPNFH